MRSARAQCELHAALSLHSRTVAVHHNCEALTLITATKNTPDYTGCSLSISFHAITGWWPAQPSSPCSEHHNRVPPIIQNVAFPFYFKSPYQEGVQGTAQALTHLVTACDARDDGWKKIAVCVYCTAEILLLLSLLTMTLVMM
eukprot:scaffold41565_cov23-Tisochrysis_lutea.AAC.1